MRCSVQMPLFLPLLVCFFLAWPLFSPFLQGNVLYKHISSLKLFDSPLLCPRGSKEGVNSFFSLKTTEKYLFPCPCLAGSHNEHLAAPSYASLLVCMVLWTCCWLSTLCTASVKESQPSCLVFLSQWSSLFDLLCAFVWNCKYKLLSFATFCNYFVFIYEKPFLFCIWSIFYPFQLFPLKSVLFLHWHKWWEVRHRHRNQTCIMSKSWSIVEAGVMACHCGSMSLWKVVQFLFLLPLSFTTGGLLSVCIWKLRIMEDALGPVGPLEKHS